MERLPHVHAGMYACMHECMYACMHVCMFACMHVCMHACMHACMYVCMYVCMCAWMYACMYVSVLVCMYLLKFRYVLEYSDNRNIFWIFHSLQNQFIDTDGDMCHLQFRNLFLFSPAILGFCKVLYVSNLSWAHVCVLTVHAQCTYSARTVRGHSARAGNTANTTENGP